MTWHNSYPNDVNAVDCDSMVLFVFFGRTKIRDSALHREMSREIQWRRKCPESILKSIEEANGSQFFVLQEPGPTAFILKPNQPNQSSQKIKVCLGARQSCTCPGFLNKRDLCIHIVIHFLI